jgi:phosphatidylserine/phosphatidylglycerophosphate/cardiolipin synthase-like enzyme
MLSNPRVPLRAGPAALHTLSFGSALESALFSAKDSIYIAAFVLSFPSTGSTSQVKRIVDLLALKSMSQGLDVRIALSYFSGKSALGARSVQAFYYLASVGIPFRFPLCQRSLHAKFVIIDQSVFFIGSHNLFDFSLRNPMEVSLEYRAFDFVSAAQRDFLAWWPCLVEAPFVDGVTWPG